MTNSPSGGSINDILYWILFHKSFTYLHSSILRIVSWKNSSVRIVPISVPLSLVACVKKCCTVLYLNIKNLIYEHNVLLYMSTHITFSAKFFCTATQVMLEFWSSWIVCQDTQDRAPHKNILINAGIIHYLASFNFWKVVI